jgi:hypothetical protein
MPPGFSSRLHWPNELLPATSNTAVTVVPRVFNSWTAADPMAPVAPRLLGRPSCRHVATTSWLSQGSPERNGLMSGIR